MDNNTIVRCSGFPAEEEQTLQASFDWEEIISEAACFESHSKGVFALRSDFANANVHAEKKYLTYHSSKQDFKILSGILADEVSRHYSCMASVRKVSGALEEDQFEVVLIHDPHILDQPADSNEIRDYYVIPGGPVFLYIKNSKRGGVYRYREGKWQYDAENTSVFEWDMPRGKLSGFLKEVTDPDIRLDAFLSYSEKLLLPNHFQTYDDFMQSLDDLKEQYIVPSCTLMNDFLQLLSDDRYLDCPDLDSMGQRIDTLNMHECMQYILFYNRAPRGYGQDFYYGGWKSGKAIRVIQRMRTLQQVENLHFVQIGKDELYTKAFEACDRFFYSKKGLANDFSFPGHLLNELKTLDRVTIEHKVLSACMYGDHRFFDALENIEYFDLSKTFTGENLRKTIDVKRRCELLAVLYKVTHDFEYLENILRLAGGDFYAYSLVNSLIKQDYQEKSGQLDTDMYQLTLRTLKTINVIRAAAGKRIDPTLFSLLPSKGSKSKYKEYKKRRLLTSEDIREIRNVGAWTFEGCDKAMKFYDALYLRCRYLDTGDTAFFKDIVSDALEFPEVYDVMRYMICKGEVKEKVPLPVSVKAKMPVYLNCSIPFKAIKILQGDILKIEADAIVIPTDSNCSGNGGLDQIVQIKAGKELRLYIDGALNNKSGLTAGESIITPAFALNNARNLFFTVGPVWKNGFSFEEAQLARCYRNIIRTARKKNIETIAFPCISTGVNQFPAQRAAEIALHTVYNAIRAEMRSEPDCYKQGAVTFVCASPDKYSQYRTIFKRMILDKGIQVFSPESNPQDSEYDLILLLVDLQDWTDPGDCYKYMKPVKEHANTESLKGIDSLSAYAQNLQQWDYDTCLAYIVYLQRLSYWSGGEDHPLGDQIANGTIRRVLYRMKELVN